MIRKFLILFILVSAFAVSKAQLTVQENGNVCIGNTNLVNPTSMNKIVGGGFDIDKSATLTLITSRGNGMGAYITFGDLKKVGIGEYTSTSGDTNTLTLLGKWA